MKRHRLADAVFGRFEAVVARLTDHDRRRKVGSEFGFDADRSGAGATATVRCRERLVQVEVHDVEAEIAEARAAEEGVLVGAVAVEQRAVIVQHRRDLLDLPVEEAKRGWEREHHRRHAVVQRLSEEVEVSVSVRRGWDGDHIESRHRCGRWVGPVR